jgi:hypothetical protein
MTRAHADVPARSSGAYARPEGVSDATVEAVGKVSEAREWVERARGHLYDFHQMMGRADFLFGDAAAALRCAGHEELALLLETEIVGRNALDGRWSFQIVDEFDDCYYDAVRAAERCARDRCVDGRRHVFEAELKEQRRTHGHPDHERAPTYEAR